MEMVKVLGEWNLVPFLSSDQKHINPSIEIIMIFNDHSQWAVSLCPLILRMPFVLMNSEPDYPPTVFEFLCTLGPVEILHKTINYFHTGDLGTLSFQNASSLRAFVGGLTISILNHNLENIKLLCDLLAKILAYHIEIGPASNFLSCATRWAFPNLPSCFYSVLLQCFIHKSLWNP